MFPPPRFIYAIAVFVVLVMTFWRERPVLVTGCTGLLGSWLTRSLLDHKARVVGFVRDAVPESELVRSETINQITVTNGDITDQTELERVLGEYEIDTIFHLAAQTIVGVANQNPVATFDANIRGTWSVLEAARRSPRVKQVIVASSDKAYGSHDLLPYSESSPLQGRHPYDVSKSCSDLIAQSYATTYGLPVCITRCGNLFGGGDLNWSRIVPGTMRSVVRGERPVIRSDGSYVRDYFYVDDGVEAYLRLAEQLASRRELTGEAFNFSNEIQVSVADLVREILNVAGRMDIEPEILGEAQHEIRHQYLDATKAREMLGWSPRFSLSSGLTRTWDWYQAFFAREMK